MQKWVKSFIEKILNREVVLEKPKDISFGHYATPVAFSLAKELRKNPMQIAQDLAKEFDACEMFEEVSAIKGFINFRLSKDFLFDLSNKALKENFDFGKISEKKEKILLEYVSANPTGPLHIGHARGAILGDTLTRVGNHIGYDVTREYYVNDAGSQMDMLGLSICLCAKEYLYNEVVEFPETFYRGEYLFDISKKVEAKFGKDIFYDEKNHRKIAIFAKDLVLDIIVKDLKDLDIEFDSFVYESELYSKWDETKVSLEAKGALYTKDKKIYLKSSEHGDDSDRVVVRDNGMPTYLAGDIIYHKNKFDRKYDTCINIWGADHHGYIKRVKSSVEFSGYDSSKLEIILSQLVSLLQGGKPYKMSKRAGTVILMSDITKEIGADALRFIFLTKKSDTHLEFDLDSLKNHDSSNPTFYINYAHARINKLFKKANKTPSDVKDVEFTNINQDALNLLYEALLLHAILEEGFIKRDMQKITDYLHGLAASVHKFYNEHRIIDSKEQDEYLKMLSMVALSIKLGLHLLGIKAKDVM